MKTMQLKLMTIAVLAAAVLASGCSSTGAVQKTAEPGAIAVETADLTATVEAIDRRHRRLTLVGPHGRRFTYTVSKAAVNFDKIQVGDRVQATVTEALAVYLWKRPRSPSQGDGALVALAPKGAEPGVLLASTREVTARVVSTDPVYQRVTLQLPDDRVKSVRVGPNIDLNKVTPGESVTVRLTDALAVAVRKP
jgi:hypothetical protein